MPGPRREYPLTGNLADYLTADTLNISSNLGFTPKVSGFARVRPALNTSTVDWPTAAGVHVSCDISEFDKTNSTAGQELVIVRQGSG